MNIEKYQKNINCYACIAGYECEVDRRQEEECLKNIENAFNTGKAEVVLGGIENGIDNGIEITPREQQIIKRYYDLIHNH